MARSRLVRVEERREQKRLVYSLLGIVAIIVFIALFGLKILVGFSLLVDRIRGGSPVPTPSQALLLPPTIDPLPEATNSASLTVTGSAQAGMTLIVYLNNNEAKKMTVPDNGNFTFQLTFSDGPNALSAKILDDKGSSSELSNIVAVIIKKSAPILELEKPVDNSSFSGDQNKVEVSGKTEEGVSVTVNDRLIITSSDGSFHTTVSVSEGDTIIRVVATDQAGNTTKIERKVTYHQ